MRNFFGRIGRGIAWFFGLLLPASLTGRPAESRPILRAIARAVLFALIFVGLWLLNRYLGLDRYVRAPLPALREVWLPLLFLLGWLLAWAGAALWRAILSDEEVSHFPDIDEAWDEAAAAMAEAGLEIREAPVFLVLGRPIGGERAIFGAGSVKLQVKQAPRRPGAPLSVSANADATYITCAGASLLGGYASRLAGPSALVAREPEPVAVGAVAASVGETLPEPDAPDRAARAVDEDESPGTRPRSVLLRDGEEVDRLLARLRHLCQRVVRERRPYCPINGILVLIPFEAALTEAGAKEAGSLCHRDLETIREAVQVECPIYALVCDLERVEGYDEFLKFFPEGQRRRFLGQQFPLVPDLDAAGKAKMVERGTHWIGEVLFPRLTYKLWSVDGADLSAGPLGESPNARLYEFLENIRGTGQRFGRILNRGIVLPAAGPPMLGGCGFAATGRDLIREQGFAVTAFRLLVENQNHVAWTEGARRADAEYRRWSALGYVGLGIASAAILALGYAFWPTG